MSFYDFRLVESDSEEERKEKKRKKSKKTLRTRIHKIPMQTTYILKKGKILPPDHPHVAS